MQRSGTNHKNPTITRTTLSIRRMPGSSASDKTPEGRKFYQERREYAVEFDAGGAFRIQDVPAGLYVLRLPFRGRAIDEEWELRAFSESNVTVPATPGGRSDEPLDLGTIRLDVYRLHEPKVGDQIEVPLRNAADGRPLDLAALRGKFVLLHFWATWRAETTANISALKGTYEAFGRDPRFVMISLSLDVEPDTPAATRRTGDCAGSSVIWAGRASVRIRSPRPSEWRPLVADGGSRPKSCSSAPTAGSSPGTWKGRRSSRRSPGRWRRTSEPQGGSRTAAGPSRGALAGLNDVSNGWGRHVGSANSWNKRPACSQ